jgi:hypothetical protein
MNAVQQRLHDVPKTCAKKECGNPAEDFVILEVRGKAMRALDFHMGMRICTECQKTTTALDYVSPEGWKTISDMYERVMSRPAKRTLTRVRYEKNGLLGEVPKPN